MTDEGEDTDRLHILPDGTRRNLWYRGVVTIPFHIQVEADSRAQAIGRLRALKTSAVLAIEADAARMGYHFRRVLTDGEEGEWEIRLWAPGLDHDGRPVLPWIATKEQRAAMRRWYEEMERERRSGNART